MAKVGGEGLRGPDKQQGELRKEAPERPPSDELPEGLQRPRKGPYDKNLGRNEEATQLPKNLETLPHFTLDSDSRADIARC